MKIKTSILVYAIIIGLLFAMSNSCEKDDPKSIAQLTTTVVTEITQTAAISGGNISNDGGDAVTARGICWSTNQSPTINDNKTMNGTGTGSFSSNITNLEPNTTYYIRSYGTNSVGTAYGTAISFKTLKEIALPAITTNEVDDVAEITQTTAVFGAKISDDGGAAITARGVCWSTNKTPTINDNKTVDGTGTGSFSSNITNLAPNTTYYVRVYATNSKGTNYGNEITFTTLKEIVLPTITASEVTDITEITQTTAVFGAKITDDGGAAITARGVCWSTNKTPTINDNKTVDATGTGSFSSNITNLAPSTTYYVRVYATNSKGTNYGNEITFTTLKEIVLPTITASKVTDISEITQTTAVFGAKITDDGGAAITARGVCWSTKATPTISDNKTTNGTGTGSFSSNITGLLPNTTYYVRVYATNSKGTNYGNEITFTTLKEIVLPTITASKVTDITEITQTTAVFGAKITDDGGAAITARGVCWSTKATPTTSDNKTTNGTGAGSFSSNIIGLLPNTTYYVRVYAINSKGTSYGNAISFTTQDVGPNKFLDSRDNNIYKFTTIGNQVWMAENLKYLPIVFGPSTGSNTDPYYYVYGYDGTNVVEAKATANYKTYGVLYNWPAAMAGTISSELSPSGVKGICPKGWHLPSDTEWTELTNYLGGANIAGGKLKEIGTTNWISPNTGATNETGFRGLPGGFRNSDGALFSLIGSYGSWWTSTEREPLFPWYHYVTYDYSYVSRYNNFKETGFSVRCIKD